MATYDFNFYLVSPYNAGFVASTGSTFTYTGPSDAEGFMTLTDNEPGGEGTVLDDNVANDQELAIGDFVDVGTATYTGVPVSADSVWTLYDPVEDRTFEVALLTIDRPTGPNLNYTLSEYPLVNGRTYTVIAFDNQPDFSDGDPVFTYDQYVCFARGTRIWTDTGWCPVETIRAGHLVGTRDAGLQPVRWAGSSRVAAKGGNAPVRFAAGSVGNMRPLTVSQQHRILLAGWAVELATGEDEVLVPAKMLLGMPGAERLEGGHVDYFHLLLDEHHILRAEDAWAESFHPGKQGEAWLSALDRDRIIELFPRLAEGFDRYGPSARRTVRDFEARYLTSILGTGPKPKPVLHDRLRTAPAARRSVEGFGRANPAFSLAIKQRRFPLDAPAASA